MEPAGLGLPPGGGLHPLLAREFAPLAVRLASFRAGSRGSRGCWTRRARSSVPTRRGRSRAPRRGGREAHRRRRAPRAGRGRQRGGRRGDRPGASRRCCPVSAPPPTRPTRRWRRWPITSPRRSSRTRAGRPSWATAVRGEAAPHAPGPRGHGSGRAGPGRGRVRRRPRGDGPHRPRDLAGMAARRARAGRRGPAGPGHARRDRRRPPAADELVAFCREELGRVEAFCREHGVIGLVDEPLEIDWTPEFMRSFGGAMLDSPGPLDVGQKSFFSITPVARGVDARRGRVLPARDELAPAAAADDPRGGARPLPADGLCQSGLLARAAGVPVRPVRRGMGGLRDAGHARPRIRRR